MDMNKRSCVFRPLGLAVLLLFSTILTGYSQQALEIPNHIARKGSFKTDAHLSQSLSQSRLLATSTNGNFAAYSEEGQHFRVIDLRTGKTVQRLVGHGLKGSQWAFFSKNNKFLYTLVWTGRYPEHSSNNTNSSLSFDEKIPEWINKAIDNQMNKSAADKTTQILKWDLISGEVIGSFNSADGEVYASMDYSPLRNEAAIVLIKDIPNRGQVDGKWLDRESKYSVAIFNLEKFQKVREYSFPRQERGHARPTAVYIDGDTKVAALNAQNIYCIDLDTGKKLWSTTHTIDVSPSLHNSYTGPIDVTAYRNTLWLLTRQEIYEKDPGLEGLDANQLKDRGIDPAEQYMGKMWYQVQVIDVLQQKRIAKLDLAEQEIRGHYNGAGTRSEWYFGDDKDTSTYQSHISKFDESIHVGVPIEIAKRLQKYTIDVSTRNVTIQDFGRSIQVSTPQIDSQIVTSKISSENPDSSNSKLKATVSKNYQLFNATPFEVAQDGKRVLFEKEREIILWDMEASSAIAVVAKDDFQKVSGLSNLKVTGKKPVATIAVDDSSAIIAIPYRHDYSDVEFIADFGPNKSAFYPDGRTHTKSFLRDLNETDRSDILSSFGQRWLGSDWGLYEWNLVTGVIKQLGSTIRSPALDVSFVKEGEWIMCVYLDRNEGKTHCRLRAVSTTGYKTKEIKIAEETSTNVLFEVFSDLETSDFFLNQCQAYVPDLKILRCSKKNMDFVLSDIGIGTLGDFFQCDFKKRRVKRSKLGSQMNANMMGRLSLVSSNQHNAVNLDRAVLIRSENDLAQGFAMPNSTSSFGTRPVQTEMFRLYDLKNEKLIRTIPVPKTLLDSQVLKWPREYGSTPPSKLALLSMDFSPSGSYLAFALRGKPVLNVVMDLKTNEIVCKFDGPSPAMFLGSDRHIICGNTVRDLMSNNVLGAADSVQLQIQSSDDRFSEDSAESTDKAKRAWMYFLGVGVDKYNSPHIPQLENCQKDVSLLEEVLKKQSQQKYGRFVPQRGGTNSTVLGIESMLESLKAATAKDDVFIMFSGHGSVGNRGLYLLTSESDLNTLQGTALNWKTIAEKLNRLSARRIVVFLDTCHAGGFAESNSAIQEQIALQLKNKDRIVVFASSASEETSKELESNGAFTIALVEAIQGNADTNNDRKGSLSELRIYLKDRVAELTNGAQHPQSIVQNLPNSEILFHTTD